MDKINVLIIGGCAAEDILKCDRSHIDLYNIDIWLGSLSRQSEPGKVAARLKEEAPDIIKRVEGTPYKIDVLMQLLYVIKEHRTPKILVDNVNSNTVVIVDPAYEIKSFYFDGDEIFDLNLKYHTHVKQFMPDWFNELVMHHTKLYDNGSKELATYQYRSVVNFLKYLEKKNLPVIMIDNLFTKKILHEDTKTVVDALPLFNSMIPFKAKEDILSKYNLITWFYDNWKDVRRPGFKMFSPDIDMIYADPNHHIGYHPTHLHHTCRKVLNNQLRALIVETLSEHKQKIVLPTLIKN